MATESSPLLQTPETVEPESLIAPGKDHSPSSSRVSSFDLTRGLICLLMAIDHTFLISGKIHPTESWQVHPDRHAAYVANWYQYGLRFVTHTCAPGFSILMGVGIVYFVDSRAGKLKWSLSKTARYITIRGMIFVLVGLLATLPFRFMMHIKAWLLVDIIFTLGIDFIIGGLLAVMVRAVETPRNRHYFTAGLALLAVATACLTTFLGPRHGSEPSDIVKLLWLSGGTNETWFVSRFPPLSWLPLVIYGIFFGRLTQSFPRRIALLSAICAAVFLGLFLAVRIPGKWGNFSPVKPSWFRKGVKEFLWTNKYCPDLAFICLFSAINHIFITIFALLPAKFPGISVPRTNVVVNTNRVLLDIGTSPFAFYFVHLYSLIIIGTILQAVGWVWPQERLGSGYKSAGLGNGWVFWGLYLLFVGYIWTFCRWYGRFKSSKQPESPWRYF